MNTQECVLMIRSLLDEGTSDYYELADIRLAVNESLIAFLNEANMKGDERALRLLYNNETLVPGNKVTTNPILFPRTLGISMVKKGTDPLKHQAQDVWIAQYMSTAQYNQTSLPFAATKTSVTVNTGLYPDSQGQEIYGIQNPTGLYWTFENHTVTGIGTQTELLVQFQTKPDDDCQPVIHVSYISIPPTFSTNTFMVNPLYVPPEYHPGILLKAAERLNTQNVGEMDRGDIAIEQIGQRLTLKQTGEL